MAPNQLNAVLRGFVHKMAGGYDTTAVLHDLCEQVAQILGATGAGVALADKSGSLRFATATVEVVVEIERAQERLQEGPCFAAYETGEPVVLKDLAQEASWPRYLQRANELGLKAVLGVPMTIDGQTVGALNVYDLHLHDWSEEDLETALVLADIATAYVLNATELEQTRRLAEQLQGALDSRVLIEQAKGKLAGSHGLTFDEAFARLRSHARRNNVSIRDVARSVVELGLELPD